jgi:hypothetical protein
MVESFVNAIQIRRLGFLLVLWVSVRRVGVRRPSHIEPTLDLGFSYAIAFDFFRVLGAQEILEVVKGQVR